MIVFDFIYFCIYSFVPDKAIFGKSDVACTFLSIFTSAFLLGLFGLYVKVIKFEVNLLIVTIVLFGGLFLLVRKIFLQPLKFRKMHCRFRKIPKWLLKTLGIMYILFCFIGFMFCLILMSFL